MFWFSNETSYFTLSKISCSEYSSPSTVPRTALVQITFVSTFAHLPSYLPLRVGHHIYLCVFAIVSALARVCPPLVNHHHTISSWPSGDPPLASLPSHDLPPTDPRSARDRPARDPTWVSSIHAEYPFALEVVVIGDQLTTLEALPFIHPPYYSMSKGDGRVVTNKQWAW